MALRVWLSIMAVIYSYILGHFASAEKGNFYVLGSDGIYVIDPVARSVVAKITNTTAPGLCSKKQHRESCKFSQVCEFNGTVFVADVDAEAVHVIDVRTHKKIETIPTGKFPLRLYCLPWRKEVWVQLYDYRSTYSFDVFETDGRTRTRVLRAQPQSDAPGNTMLSDKDMLEGKTAFVTDNAYPGIHELNLETKNYTRFRNFSRYGCTGTHGIAYNSYNKHLYVGCVKKEYQNASILEVDTVSDTTKKWSFHGYPFVSPEGRYVVFLNRTSNASRINILAVNRTGFNASHYPMLTFPGRASNPVFYPKVKTSDSYYMFLTLDYADKMAVVDMDLPKNEQIFVVKYIKNVVYHGSLLPWVWRDLFIAGEWIISPVTQNKTVMIINAETQKIHAKISGVNGGHFAVWVSRPTTGGTAKPNPGENPGPTTTGSSQNATSGTRGTGNPSRLVLLVILYVLCETALKFSAEEV